MVCLCLCLCAHVPSGTLRYVKNNGVVLLKYREYCSCIGAMAAIWYGQVLVEYAIALHDAVPGDNVLLGAPCVHLRMLHSCSGAMIFMHAYRHGTCTRIL